MIQKTLLKLRNDIVSTVIKVRLVPDDWAPTDYMDVTARTDGPFIGKRYNSDTDVFEEVPDDA